jgi:ribosomal protein S18 acetylase RimI-like enzyme
MARIRPLLPPDIREVALILCQEQDFCLLGELAGDPRQALEGMLESRRVHVMELDSSLAGVASFVPDPVFAGGGCIQFFVIRKEMRRRGIGRQFMGFIERRTFLKSRSIFLSVSAQNEPAMLFFQRLGYCKSGAITDRSELILRKDRQDGRLFRRGPLQT